MDKVILKNLSKKAIIEKCSNCIFGKDRDLQGIDTPNQWVYCVLWNGLKPFNGWCSNWKS